MDIQQLKYFKTVAEIGKISEAADALYISAPALSTSLSRLEKELGYLLFNRTNNRIILNPQGEIFLSYTNQILSNLAAAKREMKQSLLQQNRHISITSITSIIWVDLIAAFTSDFPQFTLSYSTMPRSALKHNDLSSVHSFLLASDCDIPPEIAGKLCHSYLFSIQPGIMLHKNHPLANKSTISLTELEGERLLMPSSDSPLHERLIKLFKLNNLPIPQNDLYSMLVRHEMVKKQAGIAFTSLFAGTHHLPNIRYIPLEDPFAPLDMNLFWNKDRTLTDEENIFKTFTEEFFHSLH